MKQTVSSLRRLELPRNAAEWLEAIMNFLFFLCGILAVGCVVLISAYMIISGVPAIRQIGLFQFLFGTEWAFRCSTALMMTGNPYLERMTKTIPNETIIQNRSPESGVNNDITCYFLLEQSQETYHDGKQRHTFNQSSHDQHRGTDLARCRRLAADCFDSSFSDQTDTYTCTDSGKSRSDCCSHLRYAHSGSCL